MHRIATVPRPGNGTSGRMKVLGICFTASSKTSGLTAVNPADAGTVVVVNGRSGDCLNSGMRSAASALNVATPMKTVQRDRC
ncbi:MAG: hypothetical protein ACKO9V_03705, partial [Candidatus Kapaibacterium sp.]